MARMVLGNYTFPENPTNCTPVEADRVCADVPTYGGVDFFSWGTAIIGKTIEMTWGGMKSAQYNAIKTLELANISKVWNPNNGSGITYNVQIKNFRGDYHMKMQTEYRLNCKLSIVIMSLVSS
jgi:hypothetical protein